MAEIQYAEIIGRIYACYSLIELGTEVGSDNSPNRRPGYGWADPRVRYGWNLLTMEVLIRLAEASLKLLHMLYNNEKPPRGHALSVLWSKLPQEVQKEVQARRLDYPEGDGGVSFSDYGMEDFQDARYSMERLAGGKMLSFHPRRLFHDSRAVAHVAEDWLGPLRVWPWSMEVDSELADYDVIPFREGYFDVHAKKPVPPMDWAGAIIEPKDDQFLWTLYCGFTDAKGEKHSYQVDSMTYLWPLQDLLASTVEECLGKIHIAYENPSQSPALLSALEQATNMKDG